MSPPHRQKPTAPIEILPDEDNPGDVGLAREAFEATDRETTIQSSRPGTTP